MTGETDLTVLYFASSSELINQRGISSLPGNHTEIIALRKVC